MIPGDFCVSMNFFLNFSKAEKMKLRSRATELNYLDRTGQHKNEI